MKILWSILGKSLKIILLIAVFAICILLFLNSRLHGKPWARVTPAQQGMSSKTLGLMLKDIQEKDWPIHQLLVMRNKQVVLEQAISPYQEDTLHGFKSVTKSVVALLVGIAVSEGKISLDTTVYEVFPQAFDGILDERKKEITLAHLLTMRPGFDLTDEDIDNREEIRAYATDKDWIKKYMAHPLAFQPGKNFRYFSPTTNLLTAMLTECVGGNLEAYAKEKLFDPLEIEHIYWQKGPMGYLRGGGGIYASPKEMAKIGLLCMNKGQYDGKQIIPSEWIKAATSNQIGDENAEYGAQQNMKYGYQWWVSQEGNFMAVGWGGQMIFALPELDLLVVRTGSDFFSSNLIGSYILPSVESYFLPKSEDEKSYQALLSISEILKNPAAKATYLSEKMDALNHRNYLLKNGEREEMLNFKITKEGNVPILNLERTYRLSDEKNHSAHLKIGFDGLYRFSKINVKDLFFEHNAKDFGEDFNTLETAAKGAWLDENTLFIKNHEMGAPIHEIWHISWKDVERIHVKIQYLPSSFIIEMEGTEVKK